MTAPHPLTFPFSALVGQAALQQALLLAAIDPAIGGVLIAGPRGTAKSTSARALAALLPGAPFVTLPLAASLEQLVGTLSLQDALQNGQVVLSPGLLARAHGGVLYVDEVNLLPDALVDAMLDAAASGTNTVERDGISHQHPARFVLVGTMNPEEGELRPQLLDRFGLAVTLGNPQDAATRQAIVRARLQFEAAPQALLAAHAPAQARLVDVIASARARLATLDWSDAVHQRAAELALQAGVDGVRADLVMLRAARALAALEQRERVLPADVDAVAELALAHRRGAGGAPPPAQTPTPPPPASQAPQPSPPPQPEGDWGALPPEPQALVRCVNTGAWPAKKA
ncbi:AAA domain-containing protein [Acidovorax sp. HDW3]|uniref:ATP-binding protein n=1 Tax=Acidovorax sp. HDW3 TaxID=2714923 RepID=UPI00140D423C|nr:ATP-binding protein [Acidovorax sp. HDW3]QIL43653.1 AAA domain-containing protein [Acidovorax sp. HDW3]